MPRDEEEVLVVRRSDLFSTEKHFFGGFRPAEEVDYESIIENNFLQHHKLLKDLLTSKLILKIYIMP